MLIDEAIEQIESCKFTCEGGPLENNLAWKRLRAWLATALEPMPSIISANQLELPLAANVCECKTPFQYIGGRHCLKCKKEIKANGTAQTQS